MCDKCFLAKNKPFDYSGGLAASIFFFNPPRRDVSNQIKHFDITPDCVDDQRVSVFVRTLGTDRSGL